MPGDHIDCGFYCDYMSRAAAVELASDCVDDAECWDGLPSILTLAPGPERLSASEASLAIASSCALPDSAIRNTFAAAITSLLDTASNDEVVGSGVAVEDGSQTKVHRTTSMGNARVLSLYVRASFDIVAGATGDPS